MDSRFTARVYLYLHTLMGQLLSVKVYVTCHLHRMGCQHFTNC